MKRVQAINRAWSVVARDHRFAYVVVVAADQPGDMPVAPVSTLYRDVLRESLCCAKA